MTYDCNNIRCLKVIFKKIYLHYVNNDLTAMVKKTSFTTAICERGKLNQFIVYDDYVHNYIVIRRTKFVIFYKQ